MGDFHEHVLATQVGFGIFLPIVKTHDLAKNGKIESAKFLFTRNCGHNFFINALLSLQ